MSSNISNQAPFLRTSRQFPEDAPELVVELDKTYIEIAQTVNDRTIGIFTTNRSIVTGESWFFTNNQRQQTLRQLYTFSSAGSIVHGISLNAISGFTKIYGTFTDGTNWYPLPYVDTAAFANQVSVKVTPMNIVITSGGLAITKGFVILEWVSLP